MHLSVLFIMVIFNRPLRNVFEAVDTRQKQPKKRSLCIINEHFEPVFNTVAATQIVFQRPVKKPYLFIHYLQELWTY